MVKRSTMNVNLSIGSYDYACIDHIKSGTQYGPVGAAFASAASPWNTKLDAQGWPNHSDHDSKTWGLGIRIPASTDFAGPYVLTWEGSGEVQLAAGTWTIDAGSSSNYTAVSASRWHGSGSRIVINYTGSRAEIPVYVLRTNRDGSGNFLRNLKFYRLEDETDLLAGYVFRRPFKQTYIDLNPGAIRFMNWTGPNNCAECRFSDRTKPDYATYNNYNWVASLPYPAATGTNDYSVAAVTGTPATMQHGEIVTCRIESTAIGSGAQVVIGVTAGATPVVTTDGRVDYSNGDKVAFRLPLDSTNVLAFKVGTVANVNAAANTFELSDVDTTGATFPIVDVTGDTTSGSRVITNIADTSAIVTGMYLTGSGIPTDAVVSSKTSSTVTMSTGTGATATATGVAVNCSSVRCTIYTSLDVGGRGAYPVVFKDGTTPASNFGTYMADGDYKTFEFDARCVANVDVQGAWLFAGTGSNLAFQGSVPFEISVKFMNELMEMCDEYTPARGPIDMWVTVPHRGLQSVDPDYDAADNYAINMVDVILNGANGYAGLDSRCNLIVEWSNETWNAGGAGFYQTPFLARLGVLRYGLSGGITNYVSYPSIRSAIMVQDVRGAFPSETRIKFVLGGQGTLGVSGLNALRINGNSDYDGDAWNTWGGDPIDLYDAFCWAGYFYASDTFHNANIATLVSAWLAAAGDDEAQEAVCADYVAGIVGTGSGETTSRYGDSLLPSYASTMLALGKETWMYEGGWDRLVTTATDDTNTFLRAVKRSRAWAQALRNFFDKFDAVEGARYPADYIQVDARWGHAPNDLYSGGVEGAALDLAWVYQGLRNRGLRRIIMNAS